MRTALACIAVVVFASMAPAGLASDPLRSACSVMGQVSPPAGQLLEAADACYSQFDGGQHGDASDDCRAPSPMLAPNQGTTGLLLPLFDASDNFGLVVNAGKVVTVMLTPAPLLGGPLGIDLPTGPVPGPTLVLTVWLPGCMDSVGSVQVPVGASGAVSFPAWQGGLYTVAVTQGPVVVSLHGPDTGPTTDACHPFCFGVLINPTLGYGILNFAS